MKPKKQTNNFDENFEKQYKMSQRLKATIFLISGSLGQVLVFILSNYLSILFPLTIKELCFIVCILVVFGGICWTSITLTSFTFLQKNAELDQEELKQCSHQYNDKGISLCEYTTSICCLSKALKTPGIGINISDKEKQDNRLYTVSEINEIEKGLHGTKWKNVWIFSENLATEVDSNGEIEPVPLLNINNGVKYTEFYLNNDNETNAIQNRIDNMLKSINYTATENLQFIPLNTEMGYIGRNTLPLLCGSILFSVNDEKNGEMPYFTEGYLSMRKSLDDKPIYYKMPRCMLSEYANYFKEIVVKNGKKTEEKQ